MSYNTQKTWNKRSLTSIFSACFHHNISAVRYSPQVQNLHYISNKTVRNLLTTVRFDCTELQMAQMLPDFAIVIHTFHIWGEMCEGYKFRCVAL